MGFFDKIASNLNQAFGGADADLLRNGIPGRGQVATVTPSGSTIQIAGGLIERTCTFQIKVLLNGQVPYWATVQQRVPEVYLPQFQTGQASVAIRVDPTNFARIALDLKAQPPAVRIAQMSGPGTAAHILETGTDATVVLVRSVPAGYQDYRGYEMYVFDLTVATGAPQPYQLQAGNAVPPESLPLLYPGSKLHAKIGDTPNQVVIDFSKGPAT